MEDDPRSAPVIRRMPLTLANKIAAGEVVQRPASAVKELIENAVDAGASDIALVLKGAGSSLIQVRDNGSGMSPEDAVLCFSRHATSKIVRAEDLEDIRTLGFRGEALASIAAIAQVTLRTRRPTDEQGTCVRIDGGLLAGNEPCAAPPGTSIDVRNLFYNVPARRNFLKRPTTEFRHVSDTFQAQAMANPWIAFSLESDGQKMFHLSRARSEEFSDALRERISALMGTEQARQLVPVQESTSYLSVTGFLGRPEHARKTRKTQFLFVNGRPVRSASIRHALVSAYDALLEERRYPALVVFITADSRHVDVNVHPAKAEVRFDDDRGVYNLLHSIARRALGVADLVPQYSRSTREASVQRQTWASQFWAPPRESGLHTTQFEGTQTSIVYAPDRSSAPQNAKLEEMPLLWQLHDRFILTRLRSGLMILDQQAAHERILYERALESLQSGLGLSQQLLFPQYITLNRPDYELLQAIQLHVTALGFSIELAPGCRVGISGVPSDVRTGAEKDLLRELLEQYKSNEEDEQLDSRENIARSIARCGAIRLGARLGTEEMRTMIDRLFQCKQPYRSFGGNPTLIQVTLEELTARFASVSPKDEGRG